MIRACLVTAVLAVIVFFQIVNVDFLPFAIIAWGSALVSFLTFNFLWKNQRYNLSFCLISSTVLSVYLIKKYLEGFLPVWDVMDYVFLCYGTLLIIVIIANIITIVFKKKRTSKKQKLFYQRKYDLDRLEKYLNEVNVIGVDSSWGNGKSFVFEKLKTHLKNRYYFIKIGVLSTSLDSIEKIVVSEINSLFKKEHIFSTTSLKLNSFLEKSSFDGFGIGVLFQHLSYTQIIDKLLVDVRKLSKPIIITFEDIDRVKEPEILHKMFSLVDRISGKNLKVIYQYDEQELLTILNKDKDYIEKYIPFTLQLTPLKFLDIVSALMRDDKYRNFSFNELKKHSLTEYLSDDEQKGLNTKIKTLSCSLLNSSIRKTQLFLKELDLALDDNELRKHFKEVVAFFLIKHFFYKNIYQNIDAVNRFSETPLFSVNNEFYTLKDAISKNCDFENNRVNREILFIFKNLGYDFRPLLNKKEQPEKLLDKVIESFDIELNLAKDKNEKIDHLIWNLLCNGKSEYSDYEQAVRLMNEHVLSKEKNAQKDGFNKVFEIMYNGSFEKRDNQTIFKIGFSEFPFIFEAYRVYEPNEDVLIKLFDFYVFYKDKDSIDIDLINILIRCNIFQNKKLYLHILRAFTTLKIVGNINNHKEYRQFLIMYLGNLSSLGYINTQEVEFIEMGEKLDNLDELVFSRLKNQLDLLCEKSNSNLLDNEVSCIKNFIDYNATLCKQKALPNEKKKNPVSIGIRESDGTEDIMSEYEGLSLAEVDKKIQEDYATGKIRPFQISAIRKKWIDNQSSN